MIDEPRRDSIDSLRTLAAKLLAFVEGCEGDHPGPSAFRYRLVRGHALALLDEVEELERAQRDSVPHRSL